VPVLLADFYYDDLAGYGDLHAAILLAAGGRGIVGDGPCFPESLGRYRILGEPLPHKKTAHGFGALLGEFLIRLPGAVLSV